MLIRLLCGSPSIEQVFAFFFLLLCRCCTLSVDDNLFRLCYCAGASSRVGVCGLSPFLGAL